MPPANITRLVARGRIEAALRQHPLFAKVSPSLRSQIRHILQEHSGAPPKTRARLLHSLIQYAALEEPLEKAVVASQKLFEKRPDGMTSKAYHAVAQPVKALSIRLRLLRSVGNRSLPRNDPDAAVRRGLAEARLELQRFHRSRAQVLSTLYFQTLKYRLGLRLPDPVLRRVAKELVVQGGPDTGAGKLLLSLLTGFKDRFHKAETFLQRISREVAYTDLGLGVANNATDLGALGSGALADYGMLSTGAASSAVSLISALVTLDQIGVAQINGERRAEIQGRINAVVYALARLTHDGTMEDPNQFQTSRRFPLRNYAYAFGVNNRVYAGKGNHLKALQAYDRTCHEIYQKVKDLTAKQRKALAVSFFRSAEVIWGSTKTLPPAGTMGKGSTSGTRRCAQGNHSHPMDLHAREQQPGGPEQSGEPAPEPAVIERRSLDLVRLLYKRAGVDQ